LALASLLIVGRSQNAADQAVVRANEVQASSEGALTLLIDAETGRELRRLLGPKESYNDFVFLPQRNAIALAGRNDQASRQLVIWELSDELGQE